MIQLLEAIREIIHNYQDSKYPIALIFRSIRVFINIKQEEKESLADFTKRFRNLKDIMEAQAGKFQLREYITTLDKYDESDTDKINEQLDEAYDRFIAYTYIQAVNQNKAGKLDKDLANQFPLKDDKYPKE